MTTFARLAPRFAARVVSALLGASALVFSFSAHAETKAPHKTESAFPMKAEAFKKLVDQRIGQLNTHFEQGLAKRSLTPAQKAEIEKAMSSAVGELHAAVDKAGADGLVSKEEAKHIKTLSDQVRTRMRAELQGKHANAKSTKGAKAGARKKGAAASKKAPVASKKAPAASKSKKDAALVLKDDKEEDKKDAPKASKRASKKDKK
jgi:hypothetical protein